MFCFVVRYFLFFLVLVLFNTTSVFGQPKSIKGQVVDQKGNPLNGVTVILRSVDNSITGAYTDFNGRYTITLSGYSYERSTLTASMIGYAQKIIDIDLSDDVVVMDFHLDEKPIEVNSIVVNPERDKSISKLSFNQDWIFKTSKRSLFPTNPISSIKQPQVVRKGSGHSSKIRVNGTNPEYYINGINIGCDPVHYGMFSIIPSGVVDKIKFQPQGTPVEYDLPAAVDINTPRRFNEHREGAIDLSVLEAVGLYSIGNENYFILASLRKSVLDKLVKYIKIESDRHRLPPTNFQDIFISSGLKLSDRWRVMIDQYHVRDYLSYQIESTANNPVGIETVQDTKDNFISLSLESITSKTYFKLNTAIKISSEEYKANPLVGLTDAGFNVDLGANYRTFMTGFQAEWLSGRSKFTTGINTNYISRRKIDLVQNNWNFLPPDANSDNPFIYQNELNQLYGRYSAIDNELNSSGYFSIEHRIGRFILESGIRGEYYNSLKDKTVILHRSLLTVKNGKQGEIEVFFGIFAENPVKRILEPYQVIVHADKNQLKPIKTWLVSSNYRWGPLKIGLFKKTIDNLPLPSPDFRQLNQDGAVGDGFIQMQSGCQIDVYGGDFNFDLDGFPSRRCHISGYYGYSHAISTKNGIEIPYELDTPHNFSLQFDYKLSRIINLGSEFAFRSGYPFTPAYAVLGYQDDDYYTDGYYKKMLAEDNSMRFPVNAYVNFYADIKLGKFELYLSMLNITNHSNPIINTSDGFIYDAGILPGLGIRYSF